MKIALVAYHLDCDASSGSWTTAEQAAHVRGLVVALGAAGHRVTVYARRHAATLPGTVTLGRGVVIRYLDAGPPALVPAGELARHVAAFGGQLAGWLERTRPDIVHAYHWTSGLAVHLATRQVSVPVAQSFGSLATAELRAGLDDADVRGQRMEACLGRKADGVLAANGAEVADLAALGVPGSRVRVVPPGVHPSRLAGDPAGRRRGKRVRLLYAGPAAAGQRAEVLIRALAEVPGAELVLAAQAASGDRGCEKLGKLAADLGVADRVTFTALPGQADLPGLFRGATMLVSAARHEPLGTTAIAAMAAGLPVVATGTGAFADAVIDGTTGVLLPPARPEVLGQVVRGLLANPMRLKGYGIAAADRAVSRYSWQRIAAETASAYEHFIARAGAPEAPGDGTAAARVRQLAA